MEVGSILEYRYEVATTTTISSPTWDVHKPYFVHKAHYQFTPFKAFMPGHNSAATSILLSMSTGAGQYPPMVE